MRRKLMLWIFLGASLLAGASAAIAQRMDLIVYRPGLVHNTEVGEGSYRLEIAPAMDFVTFYRGKKEVVRAPCKVTMLTKPTVGDSVYYSPREDGKEQIVRILLVGPRLAIELTPPAGTASDRDAVAVR